MTDLRIKAQTFYEKKKKSGTGYCDRQNTKWEKIADRCKHKWQPVSFLPEGIFPDLNSARVYCVCMKCCAHSYIETGWIGYYLNSPDLIEEFK